MSYSAKASDELYEMVTREIRLLAEEDPRDTAFGVDYRIGRVSGLLSALANFDYTAARDLLDEFQRARKAMHRRV